MTKHSNCGHLQTISSIIYEDFWLYSVFLNTNTIICHVKKLAAVRPDVRSTATYLLSHTLMYYRKSVKFTVTIVVKLVNIDAVV